MSDHLEASALAQGRDWRSHVSPAREAFFNANRRCRGDNAARSLVRIDRRSAAACHSLLARNAGSAKETPSRPVGVEMEVA